MKSFTDIEQSRKLSEILLLETADMHHFIHEVDTVGFGYEKDAEEFYSKIKFEYLPCWSFVALFSILPKNLNIGRPSLESNYKEYYWIQYYDEFMKPNNYKTECFNNPIDACYEMIIKLHELNLL